MSNYIQDYRRQIPNNFLNVALKSALISAVFSTLISKNVHVGLTCGVLAGTVSIVTGLATPIFLKLANIVTRKNTGWKEMTWIYKSLNLLTGLAATQVLVNSLTAFRVNLLANSLFIIGSTMLIDLVIDEVTNQSRNANAAYII